MGTQSTWECFLNHRIVKMSSHHLLQLHLLLLLQAAVGVPFAGDGIFTSKPASGFYWFCLLVFMLNSIILINSFLTILMYLCGRKSGYEDIENGSNAGNNNNESSLELSKKKNRKMEKKKMKKRKNETVEYFSFPNIERIV